MESISRFPLNTGWTWRDGWTCRRYFESWRLGILNLFMNISILFVSKACLMISKISAGIQNSEKVTRWSYSVTFETSKTSSFISLPLLEAKRVVFHLAVLDGRDALVWDGIGYGCLSKPATLKMTVLDHLVFISWLIDFQNEFRKIMVWTETSLSPCRHAVEW